MKEKECFISRNKAIQKEIQYFLALYTKVC